MNSASTGTRQTICLNKCIIDLPILIWLPFFRVHTLTFLWVVMYNPLSTCTSRYGLTSNYVLVHTWLALRACWYTSLVLALRRSKCWVELSLHSCIWLVRNWKTSRLLSIWVVLSSLTDKPSEICNKEVFIHITDRSRETIQSENGSICSKLAHFMIVLYRPWENNLGV